MNKNLQIKIKLLYQLSRCSIHTLNEIKIGSTDVKLALAKLMDGINVSKDEWDKINKFWKELSNEINDCSDWLDLELSVWIKYPNGMDEHKFINIYKELKKIYQSDMFTDRQSTKYKAKQKVHINTTYGKYFNPYNQGQ